MALRDKIAGYIPVLGRRPKMSKKEVIELLPVRNQLLTWTKTEDNEIMLSIPMRKDRVGVLIGRIFKTPDSKQVLLDEVGAHVWELCDGKHNIAGVVAEISKQFGLSRREAEVSVTLYLKTLAERKFVGLMRRGGKVRNERR